MFKDINQNNKQPWATSLPFSWYKYIPEATSISLSVIITSHIQRHRTMFITVCGYHYEDIFMVI